MRTRRFWWIAIGYFCALFVWYAAQVYQTRYLVDIGFSPAIAAWALGVSALLASPVRSLSAICPIALDASSSGPWAAWALPRPSSCCCCCRICRRRSLSLIAAQGVLGYGITSVIGAIPAEIFQGRHYGTIFGTLMLASIGGGAVGPWLTGVLHDATGSYSIAFWVAIFCSLLSAIAIWLTAPRKVRLVAGRAARAG